MRLKTFSEYNRLRKSQHELDFVDVPVNNGDIPLYIDPYAISKHKSRWSMQCNNSIVSFFQGVVDLIRSGKDDAALYMLSQLREPNQTCFGLSKGKKPRGRGVGDEQAAQLFAALRDSNAVKTGFLKDLADCELLIEGVSWDKISDATTNIVRPQLIEYTQNQCALHDIQMQEVSSGWCWDGNDKRWAENHVLLPICYGRSILLVPKFAARYKLAIDHREYYQHFVLNYLQAEHLTANSSLVRVLRDGTRKEPTKKSLKKRYPLSKQYLYDFSKNHPEVLAQYKRSKASDLPYLSNEDINGLINHDPEVDYDALVSELAKIIPGDKDAARFHDHIAGILTTLFYPQLVNPIKEQELHEGRKRVDIVFDNAAGDGFFAILPDTKKIPSSYIMVECKNYSSDPKNPELDQLSGRFGVNRGKFGMLICRSISNRKLMTKRCKDTVADGRGFIVALDDKDIILLLHHHKKRDHAKIDRFLLDRLRDISV